MPNHDFPDGHEIKDNLIDIKDYLRRRSEQSAWSDADDGVQMSTWDTYRRAEHSDGKRPRLSRYDGLWLGMILILGYVFWFTVIR